MGTYKRYPNAWEIKSKGTGDPSRTMLQWFYLRWRLMVKIASGIIAFLLVIWSAAFYWDYRVEKAADEYYQARKLEDQHQQIEALKQIATQYVRTPSGKITPSSVVNPLPHKLSSVVILLLFADFRQFIITFAS